LFAPGQVYFITCLWQVYQSKAKINNLKEVFIVKDALKGRDLNPKKTTLKKCSLLRIGDKN